MTLNRRQFVLGAAALGVARGGAPPSYSAEMPNMLLAYFERKRVELGRRRYLGRAKTGARDFEARNQFVRDRVREMTGILPSQSPRITVQSPSIHRTVHRADRTGYRIENILFQGRPDTWIPANFYLPTGRPGPFPGIVIQRGHFNAERMSPDYQQLYVDLVQNGFAVLSYDPIGQGERRQYYPQGGEAFDELLSPTLEHCAIGGLLALIGESAAGWFAFDAMRAVDYLLSRKEIDGTRIGCADHTDTGWSALYHCAIDERIRCASLHTHGTGRRWPVDVGMWNTTDDAEQWLFPAAQYGIDLPDVMASLGPRPLQILVDDQSGDFDKTALELRASYSHVDAAEKFSVEVARTGEDWPKAHRVATVTWFRRWLRNEVGSVAEIEAVAEKYEALLVTKLETGGPATTYAVPVGSQSGPQLGKSIYSIISERARNLPPLRTPSGSDMAQVKNDIRKVIAMPVAGVPLNPREVSSDRLEGYTLSRVEFLSEPGIYVAAQLYRAAHPNGECVVYVEGDVTTLASDDDDPSKAKERDRDLAQEIAQTLAQRGYNIVVADVRGLGATHPGVTRRDLRGPWEHLHGADAALANMAWSLGNSLLAMRVRDLLRTVEYAAQFGKVRVIGVDMGAVWALFAGALDPQIASVTIQRGLASYRSLMDHGRYSQAVSQFVPGILKRFDLPQVAGAIAPRPLTIIDPTDHLKAPIDAVAAEDAYSWTQVSYMTADAGDKFQVVFHEDLQEHVGRA